jgi:hypothetical protein
VTASRVGTFVAPMALARPDHGLRRVSELRYVGRSDKTPTPKATGLGAGRLREVPGLIALNLHHRVDGNALYVFTQAHTR